MTVRRISRNGHIATRILNPGTKVHGNERSGSRPGRLTARQRIDRRVCKMAKKDNEPRHSVHMEQPVSHWVDFKEI